MRFARNILFLFLALLHGATAAILAIDYGAEFTKLSLVKPGHPFDVLLDRDSKRKISSVVSWKREERVFGQEAKMAAVRFSKSHYPYVKPLLAATDLPQLPIYPSPPSLTDDGVLVFAHPKLPEHISPRPDSDNEVWTPTALLAHQLAYYRGLAEEAGGEPVTQAVVTVPAWWTQPQRRSFRDALELQGMSCLAMIGEGTGVGLNFAMTRTFPDYNPETGEGEKEFYVVYDSGSLTTSATVLAFYQTSYRPSPKSKMLINSTHIDVLGVGWEDSGAIHVDLAVRELLLNDFITKTGLEDVRNDPRAMAKFDKEAIRVKHILSANQDSQVNIESVYDDVDYRSRLSRVALEQHFGGNTEQFTRPLTEALKASNITLDDITSVIMFGGNTRVPFVQQALRTVLGDSEDLIAANVNSDEAAVLGAAYYGAWLSKQFKMKQVVVSERSLWDFAVDDDVVFPRGSPLGTRKTMLLKPEDTTLQISQAGEPILTVTLDASDALANFTAPSPAINVTLRLDSRGMIGVANAALVSNETAKEDGGVAGAIKGLFGKKDETKEAADEEDADNDAEVEADNATTKPAKPVKPTRVPIKFRERAVGVTPLSGEEKRLTNSRLTSIATYERAMRAREEAHNMLEGYLYRMQNLLSGEAEGAEFHEFSTEEERKAIAALVEPTAAWLHGEESDGADVKTIIAKRAAIEKLELPIATRFAEWQTRPKAIDDFQKAMFSARAFLIEATQNRTMALEAVANSTPENPVAPPKFSEDDLKTVERMLKDNEVWMDGLMEKQVTVSEIKTADPFILTKDLDDRGKKLQIHVLGLINRKNPRAPRPKWSTSSANHSGPTPSTADHTASQESETSSVTTSMKTEETGGQKHDEL